MDRSSLASNRMMQAALRLTCLALIPLAGCSEMKGMVRSPFAPRTAAADSASGTDPYLAGHEKRPNANNEALLAKASNAPVSPDSGPVTLGNPESAVATRDTPIVRSTAHPAVTETQSVTQTPANQLAALEPPTTTRPEIAAPELAPPASRTAELAAPTQPAKPQIDIGTVVKMSKERMAKLTNYQVRINRQERVGDALQPPEDVVLSIRRNPKAVRLEWTEGSHKGREVIYASNEPGGLMHVHSGDTLVPVPDLTLPPDSALVMRNSRHPITEAGFDTILQHVEDGLSSKDPRAKNTFEGLETPAQIGRPCYKLARLTPKNENWLVYIDKETLYPALVEARDLRGELLERYIFRDVKGNLNDLAANEAFDAGARWKSGTTSGLLGRIARATSGDAKTTSTPTQR